MEDTKKRRDEMGWDGMGWTDDQKHSMSQPLFDASCC